MLKPFEAPQLLMLVEPPVQKLVDKGAWAMREDNDRYPELYKQLKSRVPEENLDKFICVTWLQTEEWHGQPNGFYHKDRFTSVNTDDSAILHILN